MTPARSSRQTQQFNFSQVFQDTIHTILDNLTARERNILIQNCTSYVTHTDLTQESVNIFLKKRIPNVSPHDYGRTSMIWKHVGHLLQALNRVYHKSDVTFQFIQEKQNKTKKKN